MGDWERVCLWFQDRLIVAWHWAVDVGLVAWIEAHWPWLLAAIPLLVVTRGVLVVAARVLGIYSPNYFRFWPRLPWRIPYRLWETCRLWYERVSVIGHRGPSGGFASLLSVWRRLHKPGLLHVGRAYGFGIGLLQPIGLRIHRHAFMLAMTGAGKTVALITMISLWSGSVFLIDPKAQIVNALSKLDPRRFITLDIDGMSNAESVCINVLDCVKEAMERSGPGAAVLWAMRIAEALIVTPSGSKSPYFYEVPRGFVAGLILHILTAHDEKDHHLPFLRDLIVRGYPVFDESGQELTEGTEAHELLLNAMTTNPAFDGAISGAVAAMTSAAGETAGNVRSTLQEQTKWLDIPNVRAKLKTSDFSISELKTRDDIVFAFTPSIYSAREELAPLSRLLTNMTAYTFEAAKPKRGQCLMVIDELPSQGYNATLEVMLAVARSHGLSILGVAQNVELMKHHYPNSWKTFIGEADCTFWMGGTHPDNANLLSALLGKRTVVRRRNGQAQRETVAVMEPEQVSRFLDPDSDRLIVTRAGGRAMKLINEPYFKALPLWRFLADPDHREPLLRRLTRWLISPLLWRKLRSG